MRDFTADVLKVMDLGTLHNKRFATHLVSVSEFSYRNENDTLRKPFIIRNLIIGFKASPKL
jgi:hypothetical protein